uniref:Uncharacterized protein n=1 Tax=Setaria italica TaxID=4555 RepID=K3ZB61_SETIT
MLINILSFHQSGHLASCWPINSSSAVSFDKTCMNKSTATGPDHAATKFSSVPGSSSSNSESLIRPGSLRLHSCLSSRVASPHPDQFFQLSVSMGV